MSFNNDIKKFNTKTKKAMTYTFRGTAIDIFARVVKLTPVGNPTLWKNKPPPGYTGGRLRANWQIEVNRSPDNTLDSKSQPSGAVAGKAKLGDTIYITNNLPYALPVEHGWSTQAPSGMVKTTVDEFKQIVNKNAKK